MMRARLAIDEAYSTRAFPVTLSPRLQFGLVIGPNEAPHIVHRGLAAASAYTRPERLYHALRNILRKTQRRRAAGLAVGTVGSTLPAVPHRVVRTRAVAAVAGE